MYPPIVGGKIALMHFNFGPTTDRDTPIIISRMGEGTWRHFDFEGHTFLEVQRTGWGFELTVSRTDGVALWYAGVRRSGMEYRISDHGAISAHVSEQHVSGLISALGVAIAQLRLGLGAVVRDALDDSAGV